MIITVDGSCLGNPGQMSYQAVSLDRKTVFFRRDNIGIGTNNQAEFLGLCRAIKFATEQKEDVEIFSDSITAMAWVKNKTINTSALSESVLKMLFNAQMFLRDSKSIKLVSKKPITFSSGVFNIKISKWDTKKLGEISADFGRK